MSVPHPEARLSISRCGKNREARMVTRNNQVWAEYAKALHAYTRGLFFPPAGCSCPHIERTTTPLHVTCDASRDNKLRHPTESLFLGSRDLAHAAAARIVSARFHVLWSCRPTRENRIRRTVDLHDVELTLSRCLQARHMVSRRKRAIHSELTCSTVRRASQNANRLP